MQHHRHPNEGAQNRKARRELHAEVSPSLPAGVGAVFLEVDWSYKASLAADEAAKLRASLRATGAAVLLLRRARDALVGRGLEDSASGLGGALARCHDEASTGLLAQPQPPWFVRAKDGKVVRRPAAALRPR